MEKSKNSRIKSSHPDAFAVKELSYNSLTAFFKADRENNGRAFENDLNEVNDPAQKKMSKIQKNSELQEIVSYTLPRLYTGKEWYIGFYSYNPVEQKLKIKRIKLNYIHKNQDRRKYANDLILRLTDKLRRGWNPWIESDHAKAYTTFDDACKCYTRQLDRFLKDGYLREESYVSYQSYLRNLTSYNQHSLSKITYIYQLNRDYITEFLDHIYIDRKNSSQTRDNYLMWMRVFCAYLVRQGYHKTIATEGIEVYGRRSHKKERTVIPPERLNQLKEYSEANNKHFLLACYVLFYCFIRPHEMSLIKIKDISLINRTIFIPEDNSKNRKSATVTINKKVIDLMLDLDVFSAASEDYLFSTGYKPGKEYRSEKQFRDFWDRYIRKELKWPNEFKFYSLKDTGVTMMLRQKIDVLSVRDQARHSSVLITDIYTPHDIQEANPIIEKFTSDF